MASHNGKPLWLTMTFVDTAHQIANQNFVSSGIFLERCCAECPWEWTNQALMIVEEATKSYMVNVIAESHFRCSDSFLLSLQHVSYYGNTRRSGKAWTVRHSSCLEYCKRWQRRVVKLRNWETQQPIRKPYTEFWQEKKRSIVFTRNNKVKSTIERRPALVRENQTAGGLPCHNGATKNLQTCWRHEGTGAPPPRRVPPRPGMPLAPSEDCESSEKEGVPPGDVNIHTPLPRARFVNLDPYVNDGMCNKDFIPELLTDESPSTC